MSIYTSNCGCVNSNKINKTTKQLCLKFLKCVPLLDKFRFPPNFTELLFLDLIQCFACLWVHLIKMEKEILVLEITLRKRLLWSVAANLFLSR